MAGLVVHSVRLALVLRHVGVDKADNIGPNGGREHRGKRELASLGSGGPDGVDGYKRAGLGHDIRGL